MEPVIVTRRPVFNRSLDLTAYELLAGGDASDAVSRLVLEVAGETEIASVLGDQQAWLRLSLPAAREVAGSGAIRQHATIELAPNGDSPDGLRETIARLKAQGHTVAVAVEPTGGDDAAERAAGADIASVDVSSMGKTAMGETVEHLTEVVASVAASNVDTPQRHDATLEAGFHLFRGDFFTKPRSTTGGI